MKVIIAGSRTINDYSLVEAAILESRFDVTQVISGGASGVDTLGEMYAKEHRIPLEVIHADWRTQGRRAGPIRNRKMADIADALIAVWAGGSTGTADMIAVARRKNLMVYAKRV